MLYSHRLAPRRRKDGSQHTSTLHLVPTWTDRGSQDGVVVYFLQFTSRSPPLAQISWLWWRQVLFPPREESHHPPWFALCVDGRRSDHSRPLLSHLLQWDGWMGFSCQFRRHVPPNAEVPFSSPQCHSFGKAFYCSENCFHLTLPRNVSMFDMPHSHPHRLGQQCQTAGRATGSTATKYLCRPPSALSLCSLSFAASHPHPRGPGSIIAARLSSTAFSVTLINHPD